MFFQNQKNDLTSIDREKIQIDRQEIPKIIHLFWFGHNKKSQTINKCIDSWKKFAPDYEIREWNEDNFDVNFCKRTQQAYEKKKWAFVADVARLKVLYQYGGIYLDTDIELKEPIEHLLEKVKGNSTFFLFLNERFIATGCGFGCIQGAEVIKYLLDNYLGMEFDLKSGVFNRVCTQIETEALEDYYPTFLRNNKTQVFPDHTILISKSEWNHILYHYGTGTWVEGGRNADEANHTAGKYLKFKAIIRNPKMFLFIRKLLGRKAEYIYEWITYDFVDMGFTYWRKRLMNKVYAKLKNNSGTNMKA